MSKSQPLKKKNRTQPMKLRIAKKILKKMAAGTGGYPPNRIAAAERVVLRHNRGK